MFCVVKENGLMTVFLNFEKKFLGINQYLHCKLFTLLLCINLHLNELCWRIEVTSQCENWIKKPQFEFFLFCRLLYKKIIANSVSKCKISYWRWHCSPESLSSPDGGPGVGVRALPPAGWRAGAGGGQESHRQAAAAADSPTGGNWAGAAGHGGQYPHHFHKGQHWSLDIRAGLLKSRAGESEQNLRLLRFSNLRLRLLRFSNLRLQLLRF